MPIDKKGVVWGILLSVVVNGLYEVSKSLVEGKINEEWAALAATAIVIIVVMVAFGKFLFAKEK